MRTGLAVLKFASAARSGGAATTPLHLPMNLRDQLKEILPDILPRNPAEAIKGTELIELVKGKLKQEYSDATLRYHFSIMSCDPSSPIVKVEQGQGYYLRTTTIHTLSSARNLFHASGGESGEGALDDEAAREALARADKFRALVRRHCEAAGQFPFAFEQSFTEDARANRWRVPDLAVVEWTVGEKADGGIRLDRRRLEVARRLGRAPFRLGSFKLRLDLSLPHLPEDLHQCLATSEWANRGELLVAAPVEDPEVVALARGFADRYGVGVTSFGLEAEVIDDLPEPAALLNLSDRDFDSIGALLQLRRIANPSVQSEFDWNHVTDMAADHPDFAAFEAWVGDCLLEERAISAVEHLDGAGGGVEPLPGEFVA